VIDWTIAAWLHCERSSRSIETRVAERSDSIRFAATLFCDAQAATVFVAHELCDPGMPGSNLEFPSSIAIKFEVAAVSDKSIAIRVNMLGSLRSMVDRELASDFVHETAEADSGLVSNRKQPLLNSSKGKIDAID